MNSTPIKSYFQTSLDKVISKLGLSKEEPLEFYVYPTDQAENYTNFDDIYRMWVTPNFTGIGLNYPEVIESLVKSDQNTIPLWIRVFKNSDKTLILDVSQRYRKKKQILERWPNNTIAPFEIDLSSKHNYPLDEERAHAIRILFFKRQNDEKIDRLIGQSIAYREVLAVLSDHFKKYRFYPALYNHYEIEDDRYSNIVIEKKFELGSFKLFKTKTDTDIIAEGLDIEGAIKYYIDNELDWQFQGIKINK